eukprot:411219-Prymnesium_polylepis.1
MLCPRQQAAAAHVREVPRGEGLAARRRRVRARDLRSISLPRGHQQNSAFNFWDPGRQAAQAVGQRRRPRC